MRFFPHNRTRVRIQSTAFVKENLSTGLWWLSSLVSTLAIYSDNPSLNLTEVYRFFPKSCKKRRKICKKEAEVSQFKNIYLLSIVEKAKWKKAGRSEQFYYNLRHLQVTNYLGYLTIFKDMQITKLISVFEGNNTIPW